MYCDRGEIASTAFSRSIGTNRTTPASGPSVWSPNTFSSSSTIVLAEVEFTGKRPKDIPESQSTSNVSMTSSMLATSDRLPPIMTRLRRGSTRKMPPGGANGVRIFSTSVAEICLSGTAKTCAPGACVAGGSADRTPPEPLIPWSAGTILYMPSDWTSAALFTARIDSSTETSDDPGTG